MYLFRGNGLAGLIAVVEIEVSEFLDLVALSRWSVVVDIWVLILLGVMSCVSWSNVL